MGLMKKMGLVLELLGLLCLSGMLFCEAHGHGVIRMHDGIKQAENSTAKHFVLVHGACHGAWIWYKLRPMLEAAGHSVTTMDLAASGIDLRQIEQVCTAENYSQPLLDIMEALPDGEKVVLVGDSMGGINAAIAMDEYTDKIAVTVFLNAFMPDTTHSPAYVINKYMDVYDNWGDSEFSWFVCNDLNISTARLGPQFLEDNLYNLSPVEDLTLAKMLTRPGSFFQTPLDVRPKFTSEGYGSVPRTFITSKQNKAIPPWFQFWQIQNFGVDAWYRVRGDHLLMLSNPAALFTLLLEIANDYA